MRVEYPYRVDEKEEHLWSFYDRGNCRVTEGSLETEGGWTMAENVDMENLEYEFDACAPAEETQVQIWFGFRCASRDYRYVAALRGGSNNHLYLARLGAEGYDKMLGLRPLENSPAPGVWYHLRLVCAGSKIALYLGEREAPLICVEDEDAPFRGGTVCLGGSYLKARFRNVSVRAVPENYLDGVETAPDYLDSVTPSEEEKRLIRKRERSAYRPIVFPDLKTGRQEISLNGKWLFVPDYEEQSGAAALEYNDADAHVITVPSSWIPLKAWLEGEAMGKLNKGMNDDYLVEELTRCGNQTFAYRQTKSAWYRHYLDFPEAIQGKRVVLDFEGIALVSEVYWNGEKVHENIGMFCPQQIDVSAHVRKGRNILAVKVWRTLPGKEEHAGTDNIDSRYATAWEILQGNVVEEQGQGPERRPFCTDDVAHGFYSDYPGGIWRSVRLIITEAAHVSECFFIPAEDGARIEVSYGNDGAEKADTLLTYELVHKTTGEYLCGGVVEKCTLKAGEQRTTVFSTPRVAPLLWGPGTPNLYHLIFTLKTGEKIVDIYREQVGFRTVHFDGERLIYNGKPMWVRGGNHMPAHVKPNDGALARRFMELAAEHHVMATRTHVAPWTSVWLDAADEAGLMVSFEGTWSWLMLEHIPSKTSIELWQEELVTLIKRHRNRPSLFLFTMNNEMKFYLFDTPDEVTTLKGQILDEGVKAVRQVLPHLPLVCDSAYYRKNTLRTGRYERIIRANGFDDGDMDDPHGYFGWYNPDFFHFMKGEFGRDYTVPGRPCMSQECATGYPRAQDGLPVRAYLFMHQTPQTTVGKQAYENNNPEYFLKRQSMLTKELAEVMRRVEHERTCGVILFAFETWFYFQHDSARIQPMRTARALSMAYEPVLASAQLWGRHYFQGDTIETDITLINDSDGGEGLADACVTASLRYGDQIIAEEKLAFGALPYFETSVRQLTMKIPETLAEDRMDARLVLEVYEAGEKISDNEYDILIGGSRWGRGNVSEETCFYLEDDKEAARLLKWYGIPGRKLASEDLGSVNREEKPGRLLLARPVGDDLAQYVRAFAEAGGKVLLFNQEKLPQQLLGDLHAEYTAHRHEFVTMNYGDVSCFDGIEPEDLNWFADGDKVPYVASGRYSVERCNPDITVLGETLEWHGYMEKPEDYRKFGGTPLFIIKAGKGSVLVSTLRTDVCGSDPVASRLTGNLLS